MFTLLTSRLLPLSVISVFLPSILAQDFLTAISQFPSLSNFTTLFYDNPALANAVLSSNYSSGFQQTVLVPNNDAFIKLETKLGVPVNSLTVEQLEPILQYLVLVGGLTTENFTAPQGLTTPTFLTGPTYNNRTAGPALGVANGNTSDPRNGQVVFIQAASNSSSSSRRFTVRQGATSVHEIVQGGLGHKINMTAVDGYWDGGVFQIVDAFLDLPLNCTATFNAWKVFTLLEYMQQTGLGAAIDTTENVTCLTPTDQAFLSAGTSTDNITVLGTTLTRLVLKQPVYTSFLQDGDEFETLSNETVRVSILNGQIYFNDALLTKPNVLTNNGLMHVIDRVISPLSSSSSASSSTAAPTPVTSSTTSVSASSTVNASPSSASTTAASATPSSGAKSETPESWIWILSFLSAIIL